MTVEPNEPEDKGEEPKEEFIPTNNLDDLHEAERQQIETEEVEDDNAGISGVQDEEDKGAVAPDATPVDDEKKEEPVEKDVPEEKPEEVKPPELIKPEPLPPIKVRDSEGKEYEVNSVDELPDDFEPENYKSFMKATELLAEKKQAEAAMMKDYNEQAEANDRLKRIKELEEAWDGEIKDLTTAKILPEDTEAREKVVDGVFELIRKELDKGNRVGSWSQAYEIYRYRESQRPENLEADKKAEADMKKKEGAKVLSGGSATPVSKPTGDRVIEAPPIGTTLDDIHMNTVGSL